MLKKLITGVAVTTALFMTGCTYKASGISNTIDLTKVNMNEIPNMKKGEVCETWFLIPSMYPADTRQAAMNGNINHVKYVEYEDHWYFIAGQKCTVVYGE